MPKQSEEIPLLTFKINSSSSVPLYKQLYNIIRDSILEERFSPGQKLPGSRSLASELKISRYTVISTYNQLLFEGYIIGKAGSGMFVSEMPDKFLNAKANETIKKPEKKIISKLNNQIETIGIILKGIAPEKKIPFQAGIPSFDEFPIKTWMKLNRQASQIYSDSHFRYGDAAGYKPLKEEIARYLRTYRAVNCSADQIIIVNGSQQGLDLIGKSLLNPGDSVVVEDPGYFGIKWIVLFSQAQIVPVPLENEGLNIEYLKKKCPVPKLIYTTPSSQYPLGLTMNIAKRIELLQYAAKNNSWIIEDDYDSELRYIGNPLPSLQGMDKNNCVIYLGTFSKVLFPALRLGYIVAPTEQMFNILVTAKLMTDIQSAIFEQIIAHLFLKERHFTRHIRKMRMLYKYRQEILVDESNKELNGILEVNPSPAGMHLIGWLPKNLDDKKVTAEAKKNNVKVVPLSRSSIKFF